MKKLPILLLLSLGFIGSVYAAVPSYVTVNTFDTICRKVNCNVNINEVYKKSYYPKQFHKALAISTYKSGNRYSIDYGFFTYQFSTKSEAKSEALKGCRKNGRNCEIFLVNNSYANADLYYKLINSTSLSSYSSSGSNEIPKNAYASSSDAKGWKCKSGYYQSDQNCFKLPSNAFSGTYGYGFQCNSGYKKSGSYCISGGYVTQIPANAHASGNSWTCNTDYYKSGSLCRKVPANAYSPYTNNDFFCNSGYKKSGNGCINKVNIPANAYASNSAPKGWKCRSGYYQNNNFCSKLPAYASAYVSSDGFYCKFGYQKSGNSCIKEIIIPPNAYAYGSSWKCNAGYLKINDSCVEDDIIYRAGSGTGFAATFDGHIVTNHHVIDGCSQVAVYDQGKSFIATTITQDPKNDLAILKSDLKPSIIYPLSTNLYLTDDIFAAGYPFGKRVSSAVTINRGIISALMGPGDDISKFQIDAGLNPGNSGGPIVDKMGNALGVAVAKLDEEYALEELGSVPELFNFAVNSMMVIGLFRSQGIELPEKNITELSVQERSKLFNRGTFYLACGMTIAQYEKMEKTNKVMFSREVVFSDLELD